MKTTQAQIARKLGITPAYLCQIFTCVYPISYRLAHEWSKSMGKKMDWWLNAKPEQIKEFIFKQFD